MVPPVRDDQKNKPVSNWGDGVSKDTYAILDQLTTSFTNQTFKLKESSEKQTLDLVEGFSALFKEHDIFLGKQFKELSSQQEKLTTMLKSVFKKPGEGQSQIAETEVEKQSRENRFRAKQTPSTVVNNNVSSAEGTGSILKFLASSLILAGGVATVLAFFHKEIEEWARSKLGLDISKFGEKLEQYKGSIWFGTKWLSNIFNSVIELFAKAPGAVYDLIMKERPIEEIGKGVGGFFAGVIGKIKGIFGFKAVEETIEAVGHAAGAEVGVAKAVGGSIGKSAGFMAKFLKFFKAVPIIGGLISVGLGIKRLYDAKNATDVGLGLMTLTSGVLGISGVGWLASLLLDGAVAIVDANRNDSDGKDGGIATAFKNVWDSVAGILTKIKEWLITKIIKFGPSLGGIKYKMLSAMGIDETTATGEAAAEFAKVKADWQTSSFGKVVEKAQKVTKDTAEAVTDYVLAPPNPGPKDFADSIVGKAVNNYYQNNITPSFVSPGKPVVPPAEAQSKADAAREQMMRSGMGGMFMYGMGR